MQIHLRRTPDLIALLAVVVTVAFSATAAARTAIAVDPSGALTATANALRFEATEGGGVSVTCRVVLRGSLHDEISKTPYSLVGVINAGTANHPGGGPCSSSLGERNTNIRLLFPEPWHLTFLGFDGSLPLIDIIYFLIERLQFELNIGGGLAICLYEGHLDAISNSNAFAGVTELNPENAGIPIVRRGGLLPGLCPGSGHITQESFTLAQPVELELLD